VIVRLQLFAFVPVKPVAGQRGPAAAGVAISAGPATAAPAAIVVAMRIDFRFIDSLSP
jgi:hypothetical protein